MLILRLLKVISKNNLFIVDCTGSLLLQSFSSCGKQGLLSSCGERASCCGVFSCCGSRSTSSRCVGSVAVAPGLQSTGSIVVAHGLSYSAAHGIFPDQGSNPNSQVDSLPLIHQEGPC